MAEEQQLDPRDTKGQVVACVVCGKDFIDVVGIKSRPKKTCSKDCFAELKSAQRRGVSPSIEHMEQKKLIYIEQEQKKQQQDEEREKRRTIKCEICDHIFYDRFAKKEKHRKNLFKRVHK